MASGDFEIEDCEFNLGDGAVSATVSYEHDPGRWGATMEDAVQGSTDIDARVLSLTVLGVTLRRDATPDEALASVRCLLDRVADDDDFKAIIDEHLEGEL